MVGWSYSDHGTIAIKIHIRNTITAQTHCAIVAIFIPVERQLSSGTVLYIVTVTTVVTVLC
jgi:hypothetical protein